MKPLRLELWENTPGRGEYTPYLLYYQPKERCSYGAFACSR